MSETEAQKTARLRALRLERERSASKPEFLRRNYPVLHLADVMPFGKYEGRTVEWIIDEHPGYVTWLLENSRDFELAPDAESYWSDANDVRRPPRAWES